MFLNIFQGFFKEKEQYFSSHVLFLPFFILFWEKSH